MTHTVGVKLGGLEAESLAARGQAFSDFYNLKKILITFFTHLI